MEAADTMDIKADSEKTVKDILVSEGDEVQVGTPLFTYDTKDLAAKKESATLELESLNNTLSGYDAQIEQLTKEKKEAPKDQQLDYTLQIQQAQTQQKQTQYDIATKKAEIEKYDESIKVYRDNLATISFAENKGLKRGREEGLKEGIEKGLKEGRKEGRKEGILSVARNLRSGGMSVEAIAAATGLSIEEIEQLD